MEFWCNVFEKINVTNLVRKCAKVLLIGNYSFVILSILACAAEFLFLGLGIPILMMVVSGIFLICMFICVIVIGDIVLWEILAKAKLTTVALIIFPLMFIIAVIFLLF